MTQLRTGRAFNALVPATAVTGRDTRALRRRSFLRGVAAIGGTAALSACGGDSASSTSTSTSGGSAGNRLGVYGWANYNDPEVVRRFTADTGIQVNLDVYSSNEEAIAKLGAADGTAGYDLYMPTGVYIPQQAEAGLLTELDLARIPNFANLDGAYTDQPFDRGNTYSVCKDWGSTGFLYDTTVISQELRTWDDFVDAMQNEASGRTSIIDAPNYLAGLYAWREATGVDWTSSDTGFLDAVETFTLDEVAPHLVAYDSYPGSALAQSEYALMMCWNGDARLGLTTVEDPDRYRWVLGAPTTELWMDNWAIPAGAPDPDASYAWIDWILDPDNAYEDMKFHGYNPGIKGITERAQGDDLPYFDMIFLNDEQVATMQTGALNEGTGRLVEVMTEAKAKSAAG